MIQSVYLCFLVVFALGYAVNAAEQYPIATPSLYNLCRLTTATFALNVSSGSTLTPSWWVFNPCQKISQPPAGFTPCTDPAFLTQYTSTPTNQCQTAFTTNLSAWSFTNQNNQTFSTSLTLLDKTGKFTAAVTIGCGLDSLMITPSSDTFPQTVNNQITHYVINLQSRAFCPQKYTYWDCGCTAGNCTVVDTVGSGTCQNTIPFISNGYAGTTIDCLGETKQCASIMFTSGPQCTQYYQLIAPACGSCAHTSVGGTERWLSIQCNSATQDVVVANCSDSTCTQCGAPVTHVFEACGSSAVSSFGIVNRGISACQVVRLRQWKTSSSCTGAPDVDRLVAQDKCTQHGQYSCWVQPGLSTQPTGQSVLASRCSNPACGAGCVYESVVDGSCMPRPMQQSERATCNAATSQCATTWVFNGAGCQDSNFQQLYTAACNKCNKLTLLGPYAFIGCDVSAGTTWWKTGCDPTCTTCSETHPARPLYKCVQGVLNTTSVVVVGISACNTVDLETYQGSDSCQGSGLVGKYTVAANKCANGERFSCGNYTVQQVRMQQCMNCTGSGCYDLSFPSGSCQIINATASYSVTCQPQKATCGSFALFQGNTCNQFMGLLSGVCGSCFKAPNVGYVKLDCDPSAQSFILSTQCDSTCTNCGNKSSQVDPFVQCSPGVISGYSIMNHGLSECDAYAFQEWTNSSTCAGPATYSVFRAQGVCNLMSRFTCGNQPMFNGTVTTPGVTQVLQTTCASQFCHTNCTQTYFTSGQCGLMTTPFNPSVVAGRYTCMKGGWCAKLVLFNGSSCTQTSALGVLSGVCNQCIKMNITSDTYDQILCNAETGEVWWNQGCNADCSVCTLTHVNSRPYEQCVPGLRPNSMILNKGMFPCDAVLTEGFSSYDCDNATTVTKWVQSLGQCNFGTTLHCGNFNLPSVGTANVTELQCSNGVASSANVSQYLSGSCRPGTTAFPGSYSVSCLSQQAQCVHYVAYSDDSCTQISLTRTEVCGRCYSDGTGGYFRIGCNLQHQLGYLNTNCTADCVCHNPVPTVYRDQACLNRFKVLRVSQCDAVLVNWYPKNSSCQGAGALTWLPQFSCSLMNNYSYFQCSNAANFSGLPAVSSVLVTQCDSSDVTCSNQCSNSLFANGDCVPSQDGITSRKYTCLAQPSTCARIATFSNAATSCNSGHVATYDFPCGKCNFFAGSYAIFDCFNTSGIQIKKCNKGCTSCGFTWPFSGVGACFIPNANQKLNGMQVIQLMSVAPCNVVQYQEFSDKACSQLSLDTYRATDTCEVNGTRLQCGNFSGNSIPGTINNVTYKDCSCMSCPPKQLAPGVCVDDLVAKKNYRSTQVFCGTSAKCANLIFYSDSSCANFTTFVSPVCSTCFEFQGAFYWVGCDDMQNVTIKACSSSGCGSCTSGSYSALTLSSCTTFISSSALGQYVLNQGVGTCDTVTVKHYSDTGCTPVSLVESITVNQGTCNEEGFFQCSDPPLPAPPAKGTNVLILRCPLGSGCVSECMYETVPSGQCVARNFVSEQTTCTGTVGRCAQFAVFNGAGCSQFQSTYSVLCNTCQRMPGVDGYTYVFCDAVTGTVVMSSGCHDSQCSFCDGVGNSVRPLFKCVPGLISRVSVMNWGVIPCSIVQQNFYNSTTCAPSTLIGTINVAENRCNGQDLFYCGNYDLQEVRLTQCYCGSSCQPTAFPANTCKVLSPNVSIQVTCLTQPTTCANFALFNGSSCKNFSHLSSYVCESCVKAPPPHQGYYYIHCDPVHQTVAVSICSAGCAPGSCGNKSGAVFMGNSGCQAGLFPEFTVYSFGIAPCAGVVEKMWMKGSCDGDPDVYIARSQGQCSWRSEITCGNMPFGNSATIQPGQTHVIRTRCNDSVCQNICATDVLQSGVCSPVANPTSLGFAATRYTCQSAGAMCAGLMLFGQSGCTGKPTLWSTVCNSCMRIPQVSPQYVWIGCDSSQNLYWVVQGCNTGCNDCNRFNRTLSRPPQQCMHALEAGSYLINTGLHPCNAVLVEGFSGDDCNPSTTVFSYTVAADQCLAGETVRCGNYNLPNTSVLGSSNITMRGCIGCGNTCTTNIIPEGTCVPHTSSGPYYYNGSYSISCLNETQLCATASWWTDSSCSVSFFSMASVVCGQCTSDPLSGNYFKVNCDFNSQRVTVLRGCDASCQNCPIYMAPMTYNLDSCGVDLSGQFYVRNMGVAPCDAVVVLSYPNGTTNCQGTPGAVSLRGEYECNFNYSYECQRAQLQWTLPPPTQVLHTRCNASFCGSPNCVSEIIQVGQCTPVMSKSNNGGQFNFNARVIQCLPQGKTCARFVSFNSSTCDLTTYQSLITLVCGSCQMYNGHYFSIACNRSSQTISVRGGCDSTCTTCNLTKAGTVGQCTPGLFTGFLGTRVAVVEPCFAVQIQDYVATDCSATPINTFQVANGECLNGQRFLCGNDFVLPPPPPPTIPPRPNLPTGNIAFSFSFAPFFYVPETFALGLQTLRVTSIPDQVNFVMNTSSQVVINFVGPLAKTFEDLLTASINADRVLTASWFGATNVSVSMNQITYYNCGDPTAVGVTSRFSSGSCQVGFSSRFASTRMDCVAGAFNCVQLVVFNDSSCKAYNMFLSMPCGSCNYFRSHYMKMDCATDGTQTFKAWNCSDSLCSICTVLQTSVPLEKCTSFGTRGHFAFNWGISPCNIIEISQFNSNNCSGSAVANFSVAQSTCTHHGQLSCDWKSPFLPPSTDQALISTCEPNSWCTSNCRYESVPSGSCTPVLFGSMRATCEAQVRSCARFIVHQGPNCSPNTSMQMYSPACYSCDHYSEMGSYAYLDCDLSTGTATFHSNCDSKCTVCNTTSVSTRKQFQCTPGMIPNISIFSLGISPCSVVFQQMYRDTSTCDSSKEVSRFELAEGTCNGLSSVRCGEYTLQQIQLKQCQCQGPQCWNSTVFPSNTCNNFPPYNVSTIVTCSNQPGKCANLVGYNDSTCQQFLMMASPACNSCSYFEFPPPGKPEYVKITCDASSQNVTASRNCNSDCSVCSSVNGVVLPFGQCHVGLVPGHSLFNLGVANCATATQQFWINNTNCTGPPNQILSRAQGMCGWGDRIVCGDMPYARISSNAQQAVTQVLQRTCDSKECTSTNCNVTIRSSGVCFAAGYVTPIGSTSNSMQAANSMRYTCQSQGALCAHIQLFSSCSEKSTGTESLVCNTCMRYNSTSYIRILCDQLSETIYIATGCTANCQQCTTQVASTRPYGQCVAGGVGSTPYYVINRGLYPCNAILIEGFMSEDCNPSTLIQNFSVASDMCEMGTTYQCGTFSSLPALSQGTATVTRDQCFCNSGCARQTFLENTCQTFSYPGGTSNSPSISGSYSISCLADQQQCASVIFWGDNKCSSQFLNVMTIMCNSCFGDQATGKYFKIMCNNQTQQATVGMECDATCTQCSAASTGTRVYPALQCAAGLFPGYWIQLMSVSACDAYVRLMYNQTSNCAGTPISLLMASQYECNQGDRFTCSNRPSLQTPRVAAEVRQTTCTGFNDTRMCGGPNCTVSYYPTGQCSGDYIASDDDDDDDDAQNSNSLSDVFYKVNCNLVPSTCAYFVIYKGTGCTDFSRLFTLPCGQCMMSNGSYFKTVCSNNQVVLQRHCDSSCTTCANSLSLLEEQCTLDTQLGVTQSIVTRGLSPCITVGVEAYSSKSCKSANLLANYSVADGSCEGGTIFQCGTYGLSPAAPTKEKSHSKVVLGIEIAVGVLGVCLLAGILAYFAFWRQKDTGRNPEGGNIQRTDLEEPMYEHYRDGEEQ